MLRHTRRPCKTVPSLSPNRSPTMPSPEPPSSNDHFRPVTYPPGLFCYPSSRFGPLTSSPPRGEAPPTQLACFCPSRPLWSELALRDSESLVAAMLVVLAVICALAVLPQMWVRRVI